MPYHGMFLEYKGHIWDPLLINVKNFVLNRAELYCHIQSYLETWADCIIYSQTEHLDLDISEALIKSAIYIQGYKMYTFRQSIAMCTEF